VGGGWYRSGEKDAEVCGEFHEFDVLFTHAIFKHVSFIENAHIEIEFLEPPTIFLRACRKFIPFPALALVNNEIGTW
jgi:hypothetical protein